MFFRLTTARVGLPKGTSLCHRFSEDLAFRFPPSPHFSDIQTVPTCSLDDVGFSFSPEPPPTPPRLKPQSRPPSRLGRRSPLLRPDPLGRQAVPLAGQDKGSSPFQVESRYFPTLRVKVLPSSPSPVSLCPFSLVNRAGRGFFFFFLCLSADTFDRRTQSMFVCVLSDPCRLFFFVEEHNPPDWRSLPQELRESPPLRRFLEFPSLRRC